MLSVSRHERELRLLGCVVSGMRPVTLHHCHGGSIKALGWHVGMAQRQNPYLQIPLHAQFHVGDYGIDYGVGVNTWEEMFGTQVDHLNEVDRLLNYGCSIWDMAREWAEQHQSKHRVVGGHDGRT